MFADMGSPTSRASHNIARSTRCKYEHTACHFLPIVGPLNGNKKGSLKCQVGRHASYRTFHSRSLIRQFHSGSSTVGRSHLQGAAGPANATQGPAAQGTHTHKVPTKCTAGVSALGQTATMTLSRMSAPPCLFRACLLSNGVLLENIRLYTRSETTMTSAPHAPPCLCRACLLSNGQQLRVDGLLAGERGREQRHDAAAH
eukprot:1159792-Pelagomonas_calceolata.AAC.15